LASVSTRSAAICSGVRCSLNWAHSSGWFDSTSTRPATSWGCSEA
jgi:hypothetical protein